MSSELEQKTKQQLQEVRTFFRKFEEVPDETDAAELAEKFEEVLQLAIEFPQLTIQVLDILRVPLELRKGITAQKLADVYTKLENSDEDSILVILEALGSDLAESYYSDGMDQIGEDIAQATFNRHGDNDPGISRD
jgi:hypothetical protein